MIPFILIYQLNEEKQRVPVRHHTVPRVGEKVTPPQRAQSFTVLMVDHELDTNEIYVVLN